MSSNLPSQPAFGPENYSLGANLGAGGPGPQYSSSLTIGELLSWLVVGGLVALSFAESYFRSPQESDPNEPATEVVQAEMQGKIAVGFLENAERLKGQFPWIEQMIEDLYETGGELNHGPLEQRYCAVIAENELKGPDAACDLLDEIDELVLERNYAPTERQSRLRDLTGRIIEERLADPSFDAESLPKEDQEFLLQQLRWFGRLSFYPADAANSAGRAKVVDDANFAIAVLGRALVVGVLTLLIGVLSLFVFLFLFAMRRLRTKTADQSGSGPVYIETFAIWMAMFFGAQLALLALAENLNWPQRDRVAATIPVFFGSLIALCWPVVRGIPFAQVRQDIGWTFRNPFSEGFSGLFSYAAMTPIMAVILIGTLMAAMSLAGSADADGLAGSGGPVHPIMGIIATGDWFMIGLVYITACVGAPIVEETMFRGVLFRYFRDRTGRWSRWASVLFAAVANGFIFAAIHPQGLIGIPILMTLAIGFSLARQWRQSLMSPMLMHAVNNFVVTTFAALLMT